jgi:holo-[acyl-carrier protein] synthase
VILGVGVDIVEVHRIERAIQRHGERFERRVFTPDEISHCRGPKTGMQKFASRFAAKEAASKALGTGFGPHLALRDIEVVRDAVGPPRIVLHGRAREVAESLGATRTHVSLSHTDSHAVAVVVLEGEPRA